MTEKNRLYTRNLIEAGFSARGNHSEVTAVLVSGPHLLKTYEVNRHVVFLTGTQEVTVFEPPPYVVSGVMQGNLDIVGFMNDEGLPVEVQGKKGGELL